MNPISSPADPPADGSGARRPLLPSVTAGLLLLISLVDASPVMGRLGPDLNDRIAAERAIRTIYHKHQQHARRPFEEVYPDQTLRHLVVAYMKESSALEKIWGTPVSTAALRRELERIARGTRFPERLKEIYAALDEDVLLVLECFVRPVLVQRITRNFFATDHRIHAQARSRAESLHEALARGALPGVPGVRVDTMEFVRRGGAATGLPVSRGGSEAVELEAERFERMLRRLPGSAGSVSEVIENRHRFVVRQVLERSAEAVRVREYTVPKRTWESWWAEVEPSLDEDLLRPVSPPVDPLPDPVEPPTRCQETSEGALAEPVAAACAPTDYWDNGSLDDTLTPRARHTAIWTGSEMIVWGGVDDLGLVARGEAYDPLTDTWRSISSLNAPDPRVNHVAVWTGQEMVVWGGLSLNTGGRYRPATDEWLPLSTTGAPVGRSEATAVWTGSRMVVWGGRSGATPLNSGGRYDPATDSWSATSLAGAPTARVGHTAVWTGTWMVVWGGGGYLSTGGRYDPVSDTWMSTATLNAPQGRTHHASVWAGGRLIVWGGLNITGNDLNTGGRYDPVTNVWTTISTAGAPEGRLLPTMLWTGSEVLVWGGQSSGGPLGHHTGGRYDPVGDTWRPVSLADSPGPRYAHSGVWTGSLMVVWGGSADFDQQVVGTGGRYDPANDRWTPINPPGYRDGQTAIWTGNYMIVWGGIDYVATNSGASYDPLTDSWHETSLFNAPWARAGHTAVWNGDEMIVWGGQGGGQFTNSGGLYDPVLDTWNPTSVSSAPSGRWLHTALWTGADMLVRGGTSGTPVDTGGRYDPATDTWAPISSAGAPGARSSHTAIWTGSRMVIWGGADARGSPLGTGGSFDPVSDTWWGTSMADAPAPRMYHTAVWMGSRMIVWGGIVGAALTTTGAQYDPSSAVWVPTATVGAPAARLRYVALWTGAEMVVWGGQGGGNTGARYDPLLDRWSPTTTVGAPPQADSPVAVWTGSEMIVWGGYLSSNGQVFDTGGRYVPGDDTSPDQDFDAVSVCRGDCDDSDAAAWATPGEARDLVFAGDGVTLSWSPPWYPGGSLVLYDTLRSSLTSDFTGAACVETDGSDRSTSDTVTPPPGEIFLYLIRAESGCPSGQGPLGNDSNGSPRQGPSCP